MCLASDTAASAALTKNRIFVLVSLAGRIKGGQDVSLDIILWIFIPPTKNQGMVADLILCVYDPMVVGL